jgi:hypothetical protein
MRRNGGSSNGRRNQVSARAERLADALGDACEGLGAAIQRSVPAGANASREGKLLRMVEELKRLAKMLASLNEGSGTIH